jgi:hypothetical protein
MGEKKRIEFSGPIASKVIEDLASIAGLREEIERLTAERDEALELANDCAAAEQAQRERIASLEADIADLWGACDRLPHAADCDPEHTGYCTCYRGEFNSMLNNIRQGAGGDTDKSA